MLTDAQKMATPAGKATEQVYAQMMASSTASLAGIVPMLAGTEHARNSSGAVRT